MSKTGRRHLLGHLFASVKAKKDEVFLADDLAKAEFIAASRMPVQAEVATDVMRTLNKVIRHISVRCPRRSGKSWLALSIALEACLRKPNSVWVIVGLSRPSIKQIFWSLIKQLNQSLELGLRPLEVDLTMIFPNGSQILFRGAETRSEIEKLRGGQYDGVIIDECKSFAASVFTELVQDVIEPALGDRRGTLILIGTPGDVLAGPFYEATAEPPIRFKGSDGVERESNHLYGAPEVCPYVWSLHTWTLKDNVECPWLWDEAQKTKLLRGWDDSHPTWRREYLGHWVASTHRLVYRYIPRKNDYNGILPLGRSWIYVLGLDIGYKDADAIVVWAYNSVDYDVYQVYGEKRRHQNITQLASWLHEIALEYDLAEKVYDPAGGGAKIISELAMTHGLYFTEPAQKRDKNDYIELMNNEFDAARLHTLPATYDPDEPNYADELLSNRWLEKSVGTAKRVEDPKTPNDLCDAALYAWRVCDHRRPQPPDRKVLLEENPDEWWRLEQQRQFDEATRQHLARKSGQDTDMRTMDKDWWHYAN